MIILNNDLYKCKDNATIQTIIEDNNFVFKLLVVKLNGEVIEDYLWQQTTVNEGDDLQVIHLFGGG